MFSEKAKIQTLAENHLKFSHPSRDNNEKMPRKKKVAESDQGKAINLNSLILGVELSDSEDLGDEIVGEIQSEDSMQVEPVDREETIAYWKTALIFRLGPKLRGMNSKTEPNCPEVVAQ